MKTSKAELVSTEQTNISELRFGRNVVKYQELPLPNSTAYRKIRSRKELHNYIANYLKLEFTEVTDTVLINTMDLEGNQYRSFDMPRLFLGRLKASIRV